MREKNLNSGMQCLVETEKGCSGSHLRGQSLRRHPSATPPGPPSHQDSRLSPARCPAPKPQLIPRCPRLSPSPSPAGSCFRSSRRPCGGCSGGRAGPAGRPGCRAAAAAPALTWCRARLPLPPRPPRRWVLKLAAVLTQGPQAPRCPCPPPRGDTPQAWSPLRPPSHHGPLESQGWRGKARGQRGGSQHGPSPMRDVLGGRGGQAPGHGWWSPHWGRG